MAMRVFIIHGWQGKPEHGFRPWLKAELEKKGFAVSMPAMPNPDFPKMDEWVAHIAKVVGTPDENCHFVGHSLGCIAILRYLETLAQTQKVGRVVMVAGFSSDLGIREISGFFQTPIEWADLRGKAKSFVAIHSDNDPYVPLSHGDSFKEKLGAKLIVQRGMGHFSGDEGTVSLPAALDEIIGLA